MQKSNKPYLLNILDEINFLTEESSKITEEIFSNNPILQKAFCRSITIIGEATKRLSTDFLHSHPTVDWSSMAKMRDIIIHKYFEVDYPTIWDTIQKDLPSIKTAIENILNNEKLD
jgi:uncharacterized protein with HEPN domain